MPLASLKPVTHKLLDLLLPPRCPVTGALVGRAGTLDPVFWTQLTFIDGSLCNCCGTPFAQDIGTAKMLCGACLTDPPLYNAARAALHYDDVSARLILKFKHSDGTLLTPVLSDFLNRAGTELLHDCDTIIPVPLHRWRLLKRRYNQAALLSAALAKQNHLLHLPQGLLRVRATESQGQKSKIQRADNVAGVFQVPEKTASLIRDKNILLVDDVLTSGATINACTKELLRAGAKNVSVLTVARVVLSS